MLNLAGLNFECEKTYREFHMIKPLSVLFVSLLLSLSAFADFWGYELEQSLEPIRNQEVVLADGLAIELSHEKSDLYIIDGELTHEAIVEEDLRQDYCKLSFLLPLNVETMSLSGETGLIAGYSVGRRIHKRFSRDESWMALEVNRENLSGIISCRLFKSSESLGNVRFRKSLKPYIEFKSIQIRD